MYNNSIVNYYSVTITGDSNTSSTRHEATPRHMTLASCGMYLETMSIKTSPEGADQTIIHYTALRVHL